MAIDAKKLAAAGLPAYLISLLQSITRAAERVAVQASEAARKAVRDTNAGIIAEAVAARTEAIGAANSAAQYRSVAITAWNGANSANALAKANADLAGEALANALAHADRAEAGAAFAQLPGLIAMSDPAAIPTGWVQIATATIGGAQYSLVERDPNADPPPAADTDYVAIYEAAKQ